MGVEKLKGLQGLKGLSTEAREAWKQQQIDLGKISSGTSFEQQDRLYKNQQYIEKYGRDAFKSTPFQERDAQFERDITLEALEDKYAGDPNIEEACKNLLNQII